MTINGIAGASPDINVYLQAAWPPMIVGSESALLTIQ